MTEDQPFYVGINNPRFKGVSLDGYLPALEPHVKEPIEIIEPPIIIDDQLAGKVEYLLRTLKEHIGASKNKDVYTIKE